MKQVITFRIEVDHPTPLKPEGEFRPIEHGESWVSPHGWAVLGGSSGDPHHRYLVVFPQPSAAVQLAEEVKRFWNNQGSGTKVLELADKVLAEERAK